MPYIKRHILFAFMLLPGFSVFAQSGFYVPKSAKIFFSGDTSTIFSNVTNKGRLGVGKKAVVNFTAKKWENDPQSLITDETDGTTGKGGWVRFISDSMIQQIDGGYNAATKSGPSFSNLLIQNKIGVELLQSNIKVRKQISFSKGLVYLHDNIFIVGDNDPGNITGYDSLHYFVTGNQAGNGVLIRENIRNSDGQVVFPVGTKENSYTPAAIHNNGVQGDDFYVNVFDSVRSLVFTGNNLSNKTVNKTWQIGNTAGIGNAEITLQHINDEEGSFFKLNKQNAYVSKFNGASWDTANPQNYPGIGYLTTGTPLANSGTNTRVVNFSGTSYFTKLTGTSSFTKTNLWFNAYRLNRENVYAYWKTNPEINIKMFIVQRRLSNETNFRDVKSVSSKALSGYSSVELNYFVTDPNDYGGISFYRLIMINYNNDSTYSDIVAVGNKAGIYNIMLWPNPTTDVFYVSVDKTLPVKEIVILNELGQKLRKIQANGDTIIQISGLRPGVYFVDIVLVTGAIKTKKVVVIK